MQSPSYKFKAKVWIYPSMQGGQWHFVSLPKKESAAIKKTFAKTRRGFGSLRVTATIGKTTWNTSIFPEKLGTYLLPIKSEVRRKEDFGDKDVVTVDIKVLG
jgi:hypothetical protein